MKILHVISSINPDGGGPIEGIRQLHEPMKMLGHSVTVACIDDPTSPWIVNLSGLDNVVALGPGKFSYSYSPKLVPWLRANANNYDCVIVNGLWQYTSFAVWRAISKSDIPYFVFTHGMLDPWFKKTYPLKHLKKWLYWPWAEYRVLRDASAVIFTCEEERRLAKLSFWLYRANERVTSYGTNPPPSDSDRKSSIFLNKFPECKNKRIILFISRIHEKKGCDLLIEAFSRVSKEDGSLHLVMAGPDQSGWIAALKTRSKELGISEKITWTGMLQGDTKWGAFYASEVFCLPSHQENFGIVVAEALACGKPVLISNKVNIWHEISEGKAGFVASDTLEGTISNLEKWLAMSGEDYAKMSSCAVGVFNEKFKMETAAIKLGNIICEKSS
jgi:glycosyltransferase involved in cell wall biosynthesis